MLSVLIETMNDDEALARTLASLVGGAVEGVVREVIVCDRGSTDQTRRVADHAGCHFISEPRIAAAVLQAKGEWLLLLEPGARLVDGWTEAVAEHVGQMAVPARFTRSGDDRGRFLARLLAHRRLLADGLLIRKAQAGPLSREAQTAEALARGLSPKRLSAQIRAALPRG